jgi:hypothetical protein
VIEKFAAVQMLDVHIPTTDGRELILTRYTQPEPELTLLLDKLALDLPAQPPPKITTQPVLSHRPVVPSDLPHGLYLPRREPRLGFAVAACPRPEAQAPPQ